MNWAEFFRNMPVVGWCAIFFVDCSYRHWILPYLSSCDDEGYSIEEY